MILTVSNTLRISKPTSAMIIWCNKNLKLTNPDFIKKARMHLWLGNTAENLYLYERHGDDLVLPFGVLRKILPMFEFEEVHKGFIIPDKVDYHCSVPLYDYQENAVESLISSHYGILQSPAGSGKTQMGIAIVSRLQRRTLWLTHTKDLLTQSKNRAEMYMSPSLTGTITEGKVDIGKGITFATIQTMSKLDLRVYRDIWDVVVVDECHHCSGTPTAVTQFYSVLNALSARHKYGLSATVHRADGMIAATYALLGDIMYTVPDTAVGDKIMKVGVFPVGTGVQLTRSCLNTDGTLNYTRLINTLCNDTDRNSLIVRDIMKNKCSTLVLSDRLLHLEDMMNRLPENLRRQSVMITGKMTSKKDKTLREKAMEDMRTGEKTYLFATYSLAKEGLDIPRLERVYLTTPQKDYAVVTQSIGRIARTFEGKVQPIAFDYVDDIPYLIEAYKKRRSIYKKIGCYYVNEDDAYAG